MTLPRAGDLVVGPWGARFRGRRLSVATGRGGIRPAAAKREGDGATPAGAWRLLGGFWRPDRGPRPQTRLPMAPLLPWLGWSEALEDPAYNRAVRRPHRFACDAMRRADPLYDIVLVIDHNRAPAVPGAGSAIFLHLWRGPRRATAGCIAFRRADLAWILARWQPRGRVVVRPLGGL